MRRSRDEIAERIRKHQRGIILYSPHNKWRRAQALGGVVWFPPDLEGKVVQHPFLTDPNGEPVLVKANGRVEVKDRYGYVYYRKAGLKPRMAMLNGQDALAIAVHLVQKWPDIVELSGESSDGKLIEQAKRNYRKMIATQAQRTWNGRQRDIAIFRKENPGQDPPPPTTRQREAREILDASEGDRPWKEFVCRHCWLDWDELEKYQGHMLKKHNAVIDDPSKPKKAAKPEVDDKGEDVPAPEDI
jgi:hypothetical protein